MLTALSLAEGLPWIIFSPWNANWSLLFRNHARGTQERPRRPASRGAQWQVRLHHGLHMPTAAQEIASVCEIRNGPSDLDMEM
jgi:hypothetical protein